jgi:hypothetical protein
MRLILGDQLTLEHTWYRQDDRNCVYALVNLLTFLV